MRKINVCAIASVMLFTTVCRAAETAGVSGAQFLRIGIGAEASALGDASAVIKGAESMYYNPAGMTALEGMEVSFSQVNWIQDLSYSNLAFAGRVGEGACGLAVNYLSVPDIDSYNKNGMKLADSYSVYDMAVALGYSRKVAPAASVGVDVRYIASRLETVTAATVAGDIGVQYEAVPDVLDLGLVVQNLGMPLKYINESDPLPMNVKLGGRYQVPTANSMAIGDNKVFLYADANYLKDCGAYANLGLEFKADYGNYGLFALRGGYRTNNNTENSGLSLGLGFDKGPYVIDYAFSPMGDLGQAHRLSLGLRFGRSEM
jgi:hypothetical protein